jgi:GNAT superfamily N-acetyltransferase
LREVPESTLREFTITDDRTHIAFVAEPRVATADQLPELIAEARYVRGGDSDAAELALVVSDSWRRVGLGTLLVRALSRHACRAGVRRLCGDALAENAAIRCLMRSFGARIMSHPGSNTVQICLESSSYGQAGLPRIPTS